MMKISDKYLWINVAVFFCLASIISSSFLYSSKSSSQETTPKVKEWQINGALAALDDPKSGVFLYAIRKLNDLNAANRIKKEQVPKIAELLKDKDTDVRRSAAEALGNMGESASEQVPKIAELLQDKDSGVRESILLPIKNEV